MPAAGHKQSAEARQHIAEARRHYWADVRAGKRASRTGHHMRDEKHRERASENTKRQWQQHPDMKPNLGRKFDEQWRANIARAHRGYVMPEEQKRKIAASMMGQRAGTKLLPEQLEKMRAAMLAKGDDHSSKRPGVRRKLSQQYGGHAHRQTEPEALLHNALDKRSWFYVGAGVLRNGQTNPRYHLRKRLPVSADFVCLKTKTLIFVDGCYWHECPQHGTGAFPDKRSRDNSLRQHAVECGWNVVSFWEHDVRTDAIAAGKRLKVGGKSGRSCGDKREKRCR